ncbi:MAG TPA: hypothetical protein VFN61_15690, partial [Acidimicrobiales bacterium]|nr:hypothetical protein [Acidimicrobiales bacterium]
MTDDLVLALPLGARALVVSDVGLTEEASDASLAAANELARAIRAWTGPGMVIVAGGLLACEPTPAGASAALGAHLHLRDALAEFAAGPGRRVVVLPGGTDSWLTCSTLAAEVVGAATGASCAGAVVLDVDTAAGTQRIRVEPESRETGLGAGGRPVGAFQAGAGAAGAGPAAGANPALAAKAPAQALAGRAPAQPLAGRAPGSGGRRRGRKPGSSWLDGLALLDDPQASARFVASRLVYRQFGRRAWLLLLPVAVALAARLPVAFWHPAHSVVGALLATALAAAALELALVLGLAAISVRQIWLAFSGQSAQPADINLAARAHARELVSEGFVGSVVGGTRRAELSRVGRGFFAAPGGCGDVTSEHPCRLGVLGLPSPFLSARRAGWVEIEAGNDVHARLLYDRSLLAGSTWPERLLARWPGRSPGWRSGKPAPAVRAAYPNGPYWPPAMAATPPHRRARRVAGFLVALAGVLS